MVKSNQRPNEGQSIGNSKQKLLKQGVKRTRSQSIALGSSPGATDQNKQSKKARTRVKAVRSIAFDEINGNNEIPSGINNNAMIANSGRSNSKSCNVGKHSKAQALTSRKKQAAKGSKKGKGNKQDFAISDPKAIDKTLPIEGDGIGVELEVDPNQSDFGTESEYEDDKNLSGNEDSSLGCQQMTSNVGIGGD